MKQNYRNILISMSLLLVSFLLNAGSANCATSTIQIKNAVPPVSAASPIYQNNVQKIKIAEPPQGTLFLQKPMRNATYVVYNWYAGASYPIEWKTYQTKSDQVEVALFSSYKTVIAAQTNSGTLNYTIPLGMTPGKYELRVTSLGDKRITASQDIMIHPAKLEATSTLNYNLDSCSNSFFGWRGYGNPGPVNVNLYQFATDGSLSLVKNIATNLPSSYTDKTSNKVETIYYQVWSTSVATPIVSSNTKFRLLITSSLVPSIQAYTDFIVKPVSISVDPVTIVYQRQKAPQPVKIQWHSNACISSHRVKIEILNKNTSALMFTATPNVAIQQGLLNWALPPEYCAAYTIRVSDLNDPRIVGYGTITHTSTTQGPGHTVNTYQKPTYCID